MPVFYMGLVFMLVFMFPIDMFLGFFDKTVKEEIRIQNKRRKREDREKF